MKQPRALYVSATVLTLVLAYAMFSSSTKPKTTTGNEFHTEKDSFLPQVIQSVDLSKTYTFAGEVLPMDNFDVRERLDRELMVNSYWHSSTLLNLKNANRYFPIIEPILAEEGVPDDLKYLAVAESSLRNVRSPAGAKGIWQFMEATAKEYDLEVNSEVDERYHIEKATRAACQYLKHYKERFGSWAYAAAAYNMGAGRLSKSIENQRAESYFELEMNPETSRYVFRIVALKEIMASPRDFGFYIDKDELYQPLNNYTTETIDGPVENWGDFAKEKGTTYRMLKVYNPWLRSHKLTNSKAKTYEVQVPRN